MPSERLHHPSGPLLTAIVLAATAGAVDAQVFLGVVPVFVANMSGNLIHLGMAVGEADWAEAGGSMLALVSFAGAIAAATVHLDRGRRRGKPPEASPLLAVEAALLLVLGVVLWSGGVGYSPSMTLGAVPIILAASFAMGLQTASLRSVGQVAVATTYGTGAVVRIAEKSVLAARRADRAVEHRRRRSVVVLCSVVAGYVVGAAVAALVGARPLVLIVAAVAVGADALRGIQPLKPSDL